VIDGWLAADWPAPAHVRAGTTTRQWPGVSLPPFERGNFGARCGDDPAAVAHNRAMLRALLGLPSEPRWLRQVHGTGVAVFTPASVAIAGRPPPSVGASEARDGGTVALRPGIDAAVAHGCAPTQAGIDHDQPNGPPVQPVGAHPCATATSDPAAINDVAVAHRCAPTDEPEADAAVTRDPAVVLAILSADCLPVVFASDDGGVIGVAHAGWRGLAAGVLEATLDAMRVDAARVVAWLGPAAGPAAYEVGAEVRAAFIDIDPASAGAFAPTRPGHWHCDLYALARRRLALRGVTRVTGGTHCTITDRETFHSHRRDGRAGRMVTLVWSARGVPGASRAT
jgi:YfiH family protein